MSSNTWSVRPMSQRVKVDGGNKIRWNETEEDSNSDPDAWLYRERTVALLRRFLRILIEVGRLPSLLGRELFRSKVTSYRMSSFEDGVIFVHDVERALDRLGEFPRQLITTIIFQEYTQEEAAQILHCARRTVCREYPAALDRMSEIFLAGGLLNRLPPLPVEKHCQEDCDGDIALSDCKHPE
jgi:DNA-directed RNA polymerase specialized sigma24 family protein